MRLQEKLNAMKEKANAARSPEIVEVMQGETEKLVKSGIADRAIKKGEILPGFTLPDENGNPVSLNDLLTIGPLSISFYRGIW
jgi:hypothetical protein